MVCCTLAQVHLCSLSTDRATARHGWRQYCVRLHRGSTTCTSIALRAGGCGSRMHKNGCLMPTGPAAARGPHGVFELELMWTSSCCRSCFLKTINSFTLLPHLLHSEHWRYHECKRTHSIVATRACSSPVSRRQAGGTSALTQHHHGASLVGFADLARGGRVSLVQLVPQLQREHL
jgi:hypothetical protein